MLIDEYPITEVLQKVKEIRASGDNEKLKAYCADFFYDWFCSDKALGNKAKTLMGRLSAISASKKFDNDKTYVWFKNNCPCCGPLYDDFRIADLETGEVLYTIVPKDSHAKGQSTVWGRENKFAEPLVEGTWADVKKFFLE